MALLPTADVLASGVTPQGPKVVVTLPPLHSLVANVMKGVAEPLLLYPKGADPHHFTLRPSDTKLLAEADALVILSAKMEERLKSFINERTRKRKPVIQVITAPGVTLLPAQRFPELGMDRGGTAADIHLWLDPFNAIAFVQYFTTEIITLDPANSRIYERNASALIDELRKLHAQIERDMAQLFPAPRHAVYASYHPALQYFEKRYSVTGAMAITASPETGISVAEAEALESHIKSGRVRCLFKQPGLKLKLLNKVAEASPQVKIYEVDPEGMFLSPGAGLYQTLMKRVARAVGACIAPPFAGGTP